jgi:hypothetical protein
LRGTTELNDKWYLSYYVGAGGSDIAWHAALAANYRMNRLIWFLGIATLTLTWTALGPLMN